MKTKLQTIEVHPNFEIRNETPYLETVYIANIEPNWKSDTLGSVRHKYTRDRLLLLLRQDIVDIWLPRPELWERKYILATVETRGLHL